MPRHAVLSLARPVEALHTFTLSESPSSCPPSPNSPVSKGGRTGGSCRARGYNSTHRFAFDSVPYESPVSYSGLDCSIGVQQGTNVAWWSTITLDRMDVYNLLCIVRHPVLKPVRRLLGLARPSYKIWTDASGQGYGGHLGPAKRPIAIFQHKRLLALNLPEPSQFHSIKLDRQKIEMHEAAALFLCVQAWKRLLHGSTIEAFMDNATVCGLFAGNANGPKDTMAIVTAIKELAKAEDIGLKLTWVRREENRLADGLSKFARSDDPRVTPPAKLLLDVGKTKEAEATAMVKKMMAPTDSMTPS